MNYQSFPPYVIGETIMCFWFDILVGLGFAWSAAMWKGVLTSSQYVD